MLYEFIIKLLGTDILWALTFLPFTLSYHNDWFTIDASMRQPVTKEIEAVVKEGLNFRIEQTIYLIINETRSYNETSEKNLTWKKDWFINGNRCEYKDIQTQMGSITFTSHDFRFDDEDNIIAFVKYKILPDENFTNSTSLKTEVLWKFYMPSSKQEFTFKNGAFIPK